MFDNRLQCFLGFLGHEKFGHIHGHMNSTIKTRSDDWAVTNTVATPAHIPRNIVVGIRRSYRRGPGSIPGVGICFLLLSFCIPRTSK